MILDWKANRLLAVQSGVREESVLGTSRLVMSAEKGVIKGYTFRNFPRLEFEEGTRVSGCAFEDCDNITFDECMADGCTFCRTGTIFAVRSTFSNSHFQDLACDNDAIISLENSEISRCSFENIELRNKAYLGDGVGDSWVEHCAFSDIRTEREDGELFHCKETVGKVFKRIKEYEIIDSPTCVGLKSVAKLRNARTPCHEKRCR